MERYNKTVETATNSLEGMTNPWDKQISTYLGFLHSTNNDNQLRAEAAITTYHDLFAIPIHIDNPLSTNAEVVKQYIGESLFNYARDVSAALEQPSSSLSSFSNSLRNQYLAALEVAQFVDCGLTHFLEAQNIDELHDILSVKSRMQDAIGLFLHALEKNRFCQRSDLQQSVEYTLLRLIRVSLLVRILSDLNDFTHTNTHRSGWRLSLTTQTPNNMLSILFFSTLPQVQNYC